MTSCDATVFAIANGFVLALAVAMGIMQAVRMPERRAVLAVGAALMVAVGVVGLAGGWQVPVDLITPLLEGRTGRMVELLYGTRAGTHAGNNFEFWTRVATSLAPGPAIFGVVRLNLTLAVLNSVLFGVLAVLVLREGQPPADRASRPSQRWRSVAEAAGGVAFALCWGTSSLVVHGALSEAPSQLLLLYFLLALLFVDTSRSSPNRWLRLLGWSGGLVVWLLAVWTRLEMLVFIIPLCLWALPALGAGAARKVFGAVARPFDLFWRHVRPDLAVVSVLLAAVALVALAAALDELGMRLEEGRATILGFSGVRVWTFFHLPWALVRFSFISTFLEAGLQVVPGLVVLAVAGISWALVRWRAFLGLPFALLVLFAAYQTSPPSAHGLLPAVRYNTFAVPLLLFLAPFGFHALLRVAARLGLTGPRALLLPALVAALCLSPSPRSAVELERLRPDTDLAHKHASQQEAVFLLRTLEARPECTFVAPVARDKSRNDAGAPEWFGIEFSFASDRPVALPIEDVLQTKGDARCRLLYLGLDCWLEGQGGCDAFARGLPVVERYRFRNRPFILEQDFGHHPYAELELGLYQLGADLLERR